MKAVDTLAMRLRFWAIVALVVGIFLLDLITPIYWADWVLYFIPLVLTLSTPRVHDTYLLTAFMTGLLLVGGFFHLDVDPLVAVFNRGLGVLVLWGAAWMIVKQKGLGRRLLDSELARSQAETYRESAVAARELAEASREGAVQREAQTARELLMSSLQLEGILRSAMDAIITVDEGQRVLLFNEAAERMFQCPAREALGQSLDRFIPVRHRRLHQQWVESFGQSGETSRKMGKLGTVEGLRADGQVFPIEAAISKVDIEGRKLYTVVLRDITERRLAERLLQDSEERYRRLVEVAPFAIFVHRGERIVFVNQQGLALLGASSSEGVIGRSPLDFVHPVHAEQARHRIHRLTHEGEHVALAEERFVRLDGSEVDVEVAAARFIDGEGVGVEVLVRDITNQKLLQDQLKKAERLAELGTIASGMAHEIGTPMNVILGRAEYLIDRVRDEPVRKGLQTIVAQVERITRVMNQLLAFARRKPPERVPVALKDVVESSMDMFHERLARSRVDVVMDLSESCAKVQADKDQMSQVLINLIMNAVHAMPDGGTLGVSLGTDKDMAKLTISDSGHGIPADLLPKIFEPFFTTKEFGKGTGLGLTVVKEIVDEHQGSIAVESTEGKGTTFTIQLPAYEIAHEV